MGSWQLLSPQEKFSTFSLALASSLRSHLAVFSPKHCKPQAYHRGTPKSFHSPSVLGVFVYPILSAWNPSLPAFQRLVLFLQGSTELSPPPGSLLGCPHMPSRLAGWVTLPVLPPTICASLSRHPLHCPVTVIHLSPAMLAKHCAFNLWEQEKQSGQ